MTGGEGMAGPITRDQYFELGQVTARVGKARTPAFHDPSCDVRNSCAGSRWPAHHSYRCPG